MRLLIAVFCLFLAECAGQPKTSSLKTKYEEENFPQAIRNNVQNVVLLYTRSSKRIAIGSGVVVDKNGVIATAAHVAKKTQGERLYAVINENGKITVRYVFGVLLHPNADVALVSVRHKFNSKTTPRLTPLLPNEKLYSLGFPMGIGFGYNSMISTPIVLSSGNFIKKANIKGGLVANRYNILANLPLFSGASGSPIFDRYGRVVGLFTGVGKEIKKPSYPFSLVELVHYIKALVLAQEMYPRILPR